MKKIFLSLIVALLAFACTNEKSYEVSVKVDGEIAAYADSTQLVMITRDSTINDTVMILNKQALFTGKVEDITVVNIFTVAPEGERGKLVTRLFLENEKYQINVGEDKNIVTGGGELQKVSDSINNVINAIYEGFDQKGLMATYQETKDQAVKDSIINLFEEKQQQAQQITNDYFQSNPNSIYTLYNVFSNRNFIPTDSLNKMYEQFASVPALNNKFLKEIKTTLDKKLALAPGQQAPDFTLNDPDGNHIKFSEFYAKNKITMIDFWASWCGPCRAFNPTLTKIYDRFKDKGFGILGVSLDREKENWIKAIADDKLIWSHVSDLKYWDSEAGRLYNIFSIPQSYFVDQSGKIVLQSPSEEEIEKFLEENLQ